jgi:hypothetical protein
MLLKFMRRSGAVAGRIVVVVDVGFLLVIRPLLRRIVVMPVNQRRVVVPVAVVVRAVLELAAQKTATVVVRDVIVVVGMNLRRMDVLLLGGLLADRRLLLRRNALVRHQMLPCAA